MKRLWWVAFCLVGCDDPAREAADGSAEVDAARMCGQGARLTVVAVDAWARPLADGVIIGAEPAQVDGPATWSLAVQAPNHINAMADVRWDGLDTVTVEGGLFGVSATRDAEGCRVYEVFLGLEHTWFAPEARPWQAGNAVELFTEPAAHWAATSAALRAARQSIFWTTWWWQSDMDLLRNSDPDAGRAGDTALGHLEAQPGVLRRVLVNQFLGGAVEGAANLTIDGPLRAHGRALDDDFEVLAQTNSVRVPAVEHYMGAEGTVDFAARLRSAWPDRHFEEGPLAQALEPSFEAASFHGKGTIIDGRIAFVQGENTQDPYWDTDAHAVFEPRRMPISATAEERAAVANRAVRPEFGPFQDYAVRLEGPIVGELEQHFAALWNLARSRLSAFHENTSLWSPAPAGPVAGTLEVQLQATVPPPLTEQSILAGQRRAIAQARHYILVEDQYWRATRLIDDFVLALQTHPELVIIVVTNAIAVTDGGKHWTWVMDQALRAAAPDRYLLLQRRAFDMQTSVEAEDGRRDYLDLPVYNHSKLMLIDDVWLSVGSANKNNRSLLYDGEVNAVVLDAAFATAARRRILAAWLGPVRADRLGDDMVANLALLRDSAEENRTIVDAWKARLPILTDADIEAERSLRPFGTVFPYTPDDQAILEVGPDLY